MTQETPKYERLVRGVRRYDSPFVAPTYRLWLGPDHIIQIRDGGYSESYKRFYFRDIQAIVASKTTGYPIRFAVYGAIVLLCALLGYLSETKWQWEGAGAVVFGFLGVVFLLLLVINAFRGPTCTCTIYTGVHVEPLPALNRLRKARKILARLQLLIEGAQGSLTPELIQDKLATAHELAPTRKVTESGGAEAGPLRHDGGKLHAVLFVLILGGACLSGLSLVVHNSFMDMVGIFWLLGQVVVCIIVVVRQSGSDIQLRLGKLVWVILIALMADFVVGFVYGIVYGIATNQSELNSQGRHALANTPFYQAYAVAECIVFTLLGALGLLMLWDFHRAHSKTDIIET